MFILDEALLLLERACAAATEMFELIDEKLTAPGEASGLESHLKMEAQFLLHFGATVLNKATTALSSGHFGADSASDAPQSPRATLPPQRIVDEQRAANAFGLQGV